MALSKSNKIVLGVGVPVLSCCVCTSTALVLAPHAEPVSPPISVTAVEGSQGAEGTSESRPEGREGASTAAAPSPDPDPESHEGPRTLEERLQEDHPDVWDALSELQEFERQREREYDSEFSVGGVTLQYIDSVQNAASRRQLERSPANFAGQPARVKGKVLQVRDGASQTILRLGVGRAGLDDYWVQSHNVAPDVLRDSRAWVVGVYALPQTYTTALGGQRTVPAILATAVFTDRWYRSASRRFRRWERQKDREEAELRRAVCELAASKEVALDGAAGCDD